LTFMRNTINVKLVPN